MKTKTVVNYVRGAAVLLPVVLLACAGGYPPPQDLVTARAELVRAKQGPAAQLNPTDIHEADIALAKAESAFNDDPTSAVTTDLAAIATLKAQAAEVAAGTMQANAAQVTAAADLKAVEAGKLRDANGQLQATKGSLASTQNALTQTQGALAQQRQETDAERAQRVKLEAQLKDAKDTLARIANVKEDDRGLVVTFQGESLFVTAKSDLLPAAMVKLDQVAQTLRGQERKIDVVGYADNQGGASQYNQDLSEKRAAAVKEYLIAKGIPTDLIRSEGRGATQFVADNNTIEGRAANRRVEIVVEPKGKSVASSP